jgi:hypothetical protein
MLPDLSDSQRLEHIMSSNMTANTHLFQVICYGLAQSDHIKLKIAFKIGEWVRMPNDTWLKY